MTPPSAASAVNRFGLGARPGDLQEAVSDPQGWLRAQLQDDPGVPERFARLPSSLDYLRRENDFRGERLAERRRRKRSEGPETSGDAADGDPVQRFVASFRETFGDEILAELDARYAEAITSAAGFRERLVHFWSNHFAVSIDKHPAALFAAPMEREAIRPHVLGRFADLLHAAETHPAMLRYLDNTRSIGEQSAFATRAERFLARRQEGRPPRELGLNENLAREILELHTLGVGGGYEQADVLELARAITGWGVPGPRDFRRGEPRQAFVFRDAAHAPGPRRLLGRQYPEGGVEQGEAMLRDLAAHPATAHHLAFKLARHFVADEPPPALVEHVAAVWRESDGHLPAVYGALIDHPAAFSGEAVKFKTPHDFVVSALRALEVRQLEARRLVGLLNELGQRPFMPRSPAGFGDTTQDWNGADALFKRVQVAQALAERASRGSPPELAAAVLGDGAGRELTVALQRAESAEQGIALLLASPTFQWRA